MTSSARSEAVQRGRVKCPHASSPAHQAVILGASWPRLRSPMRASKRIRDIRDRRTRATKRPTKRTQATKRTLRTAGSAGPSHHTTGTSEPRCRPPCSASWAPVHESDAHRAPLTAGTHLASCGGVSCKHQVVRPPRMRPSEALGHTRSLVFRSRTGRLRSRTGRQGMHQEACTRMASPHAGHDA